MTYDKAAGKAVINGVVVTEQAPAAVPAAEDVPLYRSPEDAPNLTGKQIKAAIAERETTEGMVNLNQGWLPGRSPNNLARRSDPNRLWDRATNRFIPGTEFGGNPIRRR